MHFSQRLLLLTAVVGGVYFAATPAAAQFDNFWEPIGPANWSDDGNWSDGGEPDAVNFQDQAVINNGGTAFVQDTRPDPGGIILGRVAGGTGNNSGTLEIRSGGNLTAVSGVNNTGALVVGQDATGTLRVLGGGQLAAVSISSSGANSSIALSGNGQLTTTGTATLNVVTDLVGQAANLSADQAITLGGSSRLQVDIAGSSAPLIKAGLSVSLGGTLEVDFGGPTPAAGSTWNLFDAGAVVGEFSQVAIAGGSLNLGQRLSVRAVPDGSSMNGVFGQLALDQLLVLEINRDTGAMNIMNPAGASPIGIDSYAVTSDNSSFNTAGGVWTSLADQPAVPDWIEANPGPMQLAELRTADGVTTVNGGSHLSLGTPWNPQFTQLGQNLEDVVFRYAGADGDVLDAPVIFTGATINDIALFVDEQGNAQLRNASGFLVDIEGYSITSESLSLNETGWDSLQNNANVSNWLEANPNAGALSEFKTSGVETLTAQRSFDLGQLFNPAGEQDLQFEYLVAGASQPTSGRVLYQDLPAPFEPGDGDFDSDGDVDGRDFLTLQRGFGTSFDAADFDDFEANFGAGAGATPAAGAVPEPATSVLLVVAMLATCNAHGIRSRKMI